jgi:hypothetical protein
VPRVLWGRNKGMECVLRERGLYPASGGLKNACENEKAHNTETNQCCCRRLLAVQPDFVAECSALQHMVEEHVPLVRTFEPLTGHSNTVMAARHLCLFLPKVGLPPPTQHVCPSTCALFPPATTRVDFPPLPSAHSFIAS